MKTEKTYNVVRGIFFLSILLYVLSLAVSFLWVGRYCRPPILIERVAEIIAMLALFSFFFLMYRVLTHVYSIVMKRRGSEKEKSSEVFADIFAVDTDFEGYIEAFMGDVGKKKIEFDSELYQNHLEEATEEFRLLLPRFIFRTKRALLGIICFSILSLIPIFASLYILDYSVEMYVFGEAGFADQGISEGNPCDWTIEGIYYSIVTMTTLGYGDICPGASSLARMLVILQVVASFILIAVVMGIVLQHLETVYYPEEFKRILNNEMEIMHK